MAIRIEHFRIDLDSPAGEYCAGSDVTGKVTFKSYEPLKVRAIVIKFTGKARTSWIDDSRGIHYSANEEYLSNEYYIAGGPSRLIVLPAGNHVYKFGSTLPPKLPSSFESKHGNIRYKVECKIDRPWNFDELAEAMFNVVTPIDLNCIEEAKAPVNLALEKWFCWCCCRSGPLTVAMSLPHSGFVAGESVPVLVEVDNSSRKVRVVHIVVSLVKKLRWKAQSEEKSEKTELETLKLAAVESGSSKTFTEELQVPAGTVDNLNECSIIKCNFYVRLVAELSVLHCDLEGSVPIYLGTVPLGSAPAPASFPPDRPTHSAPPPDTGFDHSPGPVQAIYHPNSSHRVSKDPHASYLLQSPTDMKGYEPSPHRPKKF